MVEAVQVKSAFLSQQFYLLKLQMYGCQPTRENVFRQVGLQGLLLIGQGTHENSEVNLSDELVYKDFVLSKLNEFSRVKQEMIRKEDFQSCRHIHEQMKVIRADGDAVTLLLKQREEYSHQGNFLKMHGVEKQLQIIKARLDKMQPAVVTQERIERDYVNPCRPVEHSEFREDQMF